MNKLCLRLAMGLVACASLTANAKDLAGWNPVFTPTPATADLPPDTLHYYITSTGQVVVERSEAGVLSNVPQASWWYGCSPTSAGMLLGYYDRVGYGSLLYSNLVKGGVAELSAFTDNGTLLRAAIASARHISDFYHNGVNATGDDLSGTPTGPLDCLADFMGTSQDAYGNANGETRFHYYLDGTRFYVKDAYNLGSTQYNTDGMFGIYEYINYFAGYDLGSPSTSTKLYTQKIYDPSGGGGLGIPGSTDGFTFEDFKAEIDAQRPVLIHLTDHTMVGFGYDDATQVIHVRDTWTSGDHTMAWGGSYAGLDQWGVTALELAGGTAVPLPSALAMGLVGLTLIIRPRKRTPC